MGVRAVPFRSGSRLSAVAVSALAPRWASAAVWNLDAGSVIIPNPALAVGEPMSFRDMHDEGMHLHSGDGPGFEGPSEDDLALIRRMSPPENEIPAPVAISTVLARTDEVAIGLIGAQVFTGGVRFELVVRLRHEPRGTMAQKSYALLNGFPAENSDESLLLGLEFADGRTVMNLPHPGFRGMPTAGGPDEPMLTQAGGGGGGRSFDQSFWLTPLPPAGPLLVVCAWTAVGIAETRTTLDGTAIAQAGARAVTLWAPSPPEPEKPVEPPPPKVPEGGWFASVVRQGRGPAGSPG